MSKHSRSLASYADIRAVLEKALSSGGLRLTFPHRAKATTFVSRANTFRVLLRQYNASKGLDMTCTYDQLMICRPRKESELIVDLVFRGFDFEAATLEGEAVTIDPKESAKMESQREDEEFFASLKPQQPFATQSLGLKRRDKE